MTNVEVAQLRYEKTGLIAELEHASVAGGMPENLERIIRRRVHEIQQLLANNERNIDNER